MFGEPSDKDKQMARAYGGVARGAPKRQIPKGFRDIETPTSQMNNRASKQNMQKVAGMVAGFNKDDPRHA